MIHLFLFRTTTKVTQFNHSTSVALINCTQGIEITSDPNNGVSRVLSIVLAHCSFWKFKWHRYLITHVHKPDWLTVSARLLRSWGLVRPLPAEHATWDPNRSWYNSIPNRAPEKSMYSFSEKERESVCVCVW